MYNHTRLPAKSSALDNVAKLERQLARLEVAEGKKLKNEDILRLEKNGDISYETIRTVAVPFEECTAASEPMMMAEPAEHENAANSNLLPNKLPETPVIEEIGNLIGVFPAAGQSPTDAAAVAEINVAVALAAKLAVAETKEQSALTAGICCHEADKSSN